MSLQAYQQTQNTTGDPRNTEYRLFAQVTRALMDVKSNDRMALIKALNWNRRLWIALQSDCTSERNILPDAAKAGIISLAIWVERHSRMVIQQNADVAPLIDVNRSIMGGLANAA